MLKQVKYFSNKFIKDYELIKRRGYNLKEFEEIVNLLLKELEIPVKYRVHKLSDSKDFKGMKELHIRPDWLLIYYIDYSSSTLVLVRTGTHSDLF